MLSAWMDAATQHSIGCAQFWHNPVASAMQSQLPRTVLLSLPHNAGGVTAHNWQSDSTARHACDGESLRQW